MNLSWTNFDDLVYLRDLKQLKFLNLEGVLVLKHLEVLEELVTLENLKIERSALEGYNYEEKLKHIKVIVI